MRVICVLLSTCVHECMPVRAPTVAYVSACVACVPMSLYLYVRISEFISKAVRVPACLCCVCTCERVSFLLQTLISFVFVFVST